MSSIVYLAGPITGLTHTECANWRRGMTGMLGDYGILTRDPMRATPAPPNGGAYDDDPQMLDLAHDPYDRDMNDIWVSDIVFFNFLNTERVSLGSMWELGYAKALGKYIVVAVSHADWHDHYFVRRSADVLVSSLDGAVEAIKERSPQTTEAT